jgi:signal transduction histidine kinase
MSYRGFKRLLGETALETKSRMYLGVGVLVLMAASFYAYARQTEGLAFDQLTHTGRTLVSPIVARAHVRGELAVGMDQLQQQIEKNWPEGLQTYSYRIVTPAAVRPERQAAPDDLAVLADFLNDPAKAEMTRELPADRAFVYYGAVRAAAACVHCHADPAAVRDAAPNLQPGDLMAVVSIRLSTESIEAGFHQNRALLLTFALGTTALVLAGSYVIIRYVVVKPVKHLKSVADAIAAGQINVRSEIQTGDEFEDLSDAFNRMLRNLTNVQDRNRELIATLDKKVDELARLNMALFESDRLKGDFLSTMSHELRTPLNSIIGFSEVLLNADNLTDKQHRYAANIMTGGQQLLALVNDVLDLARAESGRMRLHPRESRVADLCEQAVAQTRPAADKKGVELRVKVPADLPPVRQDAGKIGQILGNLLSNAVKFTPEGGRVTLTAGVEGEHLVLTVADTGVGIAPEEQELVFAKFRQSANPLTREQGGTGLGLSIVRELAKLLGGDVRLRSDLGRGSTFTVRVAANVAG